MMKCIYALGTFFSAFLATASAVADESVFAPGDTLSSEAFGAVEGIVLFAAAVLGIAAVYGMILFGRSVHRRTENALFDVERLLMDKRS